MIRLKQRNIGYFMILFILSLFSLSKSLPVKQSDNFQPGNDLVNCLNESADPCNDFYEYACGQWTNQHTPAEGFPIWSNWYLISHSVRPKIKDLLTRANSETDIEAIRKARKVYQACMNKDAIEAAGAKPVIKLVNDNGGWPLVMKSDEWKAKNLTWQQIHSRFLKTLGVEALFAIQMPPDVKNSSITRLVVSEPNLVLKKKELVDSKNFRQSFAYTGYKLRVTDIFLRRSSVEEELGNVSLLVELNNFEKELAEITHDEQGINNIDEWYSLMTIDELQELYDSANMTSPTAQINWLETIRDMFTLTPEITVNGSEPIIVPGKEFFPKFAALLNKTAPETIVNYIVWCVITDVSLYANDELRMLLSDFNNRRVGADPIGTREYDCVSLEQMGRAASYLFVKEHSSEESKEAVQELVGNIQEAMKNYIQQSTWLDNETKNLATEKIDAIIKFIGYPDEYTDSNINEYYAEFTPTDSYFENEMRSRVFQMKRALRELRKPTNKKEWPVEPKAINAYYIPVLNTMGEY
uniref:Ece1_4 protein n=1 Tax=Fopius arisanus TaxID=64838 RepID=A0A0C9S1Y3_9HYME